MSPREEPTPSPLEIRRRLMEPPNGRISPDTEVVPSRDWLRRVHNRASELRRKAERAAWEAAVAAAIARKAEEQAAHQEGTSVPESPPDIRPIIGSKAMCRSIIRICAKYHRVTVNDIMSDRRTANVVLPRQVAMYLAKELTTLSLPAIGRLFGSRHHTTILHAVRKIWHLVEDDPDFAAEIAVLRETAENQRVVIDVPGKFAAGKPLWREDAPQKQGEG